MFPDNTFLINFAIAHRRKWIDPDTLWGYVQTLKVHNRGTPPGVRDRTAFDKWLPA
jgi:hypothetical protein